MDAVLFVRLELSGGDAFLFTQPSETVELDAIPSLDDVRVSPAVIEPGVSIGQRETVTASFKDHHYRFAAESFTAGTFWTKFRAIYETIQGATLRVYRGERGQTLAEMDLRTYVVDKFQLTRNGASITAKDPLYQLNADSAQVPEPTEGELIADVLAADSELTLFPSGIGNAQYPASGRLCIGGEEVVDFTRSGDVFTITRGVAGTEPQDHDAGARAQLCLVYDDAAPSTIVDDLLTRSGLAATYWDAGDWTETDAYVGVTFETTITEPTPVKKLLDELCEQAALVMWYDPAEATINLAPLAPVSSGYAVTADNVIADSFEIDEQPDKRVSQAWIYYARTDTTKKIDESSNYARVAVQVASNAADYELQSIKKVFTRWIPSKTVAQRLAALQIARYSRPPRRFSFELFPGDDLPTLASGVTVAHWRLVDANGAAVEVPAQIVSVEEQLDRVQFVAEEMGFDTPIIDPGTEGDVSLEDHAVSAIGVPGAIAGVHFSSAGLLSMFGTNVDATPAIGEDEWFTSGNVPGVGNDYFIRVQASGATPDGNALSTWLTLASSRQWSIESTSGTKNCTLTVEISTTPSTAGLEDSCTITLEAIGP